MDLHLILSVSIPKHKSRRFLSSPSYCQIYLLFHLSWNVWYFYIYLLICKYFVRHSRHCIKIALRRIVWILCLLNKLCVLTNDVEIKYVLPWKPFQRTTWNRLSGLPRDLPNHKLLEPVQQWLCWLEPQTAPFLNPEIMTRCTSMWS